MNQHIGNFTMDVELQGNGLLNVYITEEDGSGDHYNNIDIDTACEYLKDMIQDCIGRRDW